MKQKGDNYDAIVVGAGPAGSTAARRLAQTGLQVLITEQRQAVGEHVQCAEFVPRIITNYVGLRASDVAQQLNGIKTFINGEVASVVRAPGYVLHRSQWDKQLANAAIAAGADLITGVRAVHVEGSVVTLLCGDEYQEVTGKFILGCDGPCSLISKKLGNEPGDTCIALQYELTLVKPLDYAEIYFAPAWYGGYAWVFPKGTTANVGLAVHTSHKGRLKELLADFYRTLVTRQIVQEITRPATTGGLIPSGGLVQCLANAHMLVAGDAAGCTHPITGGGIMNAVVSGHLAAAAVIRQANTQGVEQLADSYTSAIQAEYGRQFAIARDRLSNRNQGWTDNKAEFTALIRRNWIAFPEYYAQ
ncbi:MAG: kmo [Sporomusa sp.]|jgi:geranylgeranyl reductase family protein|nr:kmo [Sporomusa sp.]